MKNRAKSWAHREISGLSGRLAFSKPDLHSCSDFAVIIRRVSAAGDT
jgi:hypothetical protein